MRLSRLLFPILLAAATPAFAQTVAASLPKLSPSTRRYVAAVEGAPDQAQPRGWVYKTCNGQPCISALVQVADADKASAALRTLGAYIGTRAGAVWTVQVPVAKVAAFTQAPGLRYIELDEPMALPQMDDSARRKTRVDSAHSGIGLALPYSGAGVVVGVMDFGFDYNHPLFWDTTGTRYRLRRVWELGGTGTPPPGYSYGREIADTATLKGLTTDNAKQTHGTQVAGMALGSGWGSPTNGRAFRGTAFESEAVLVGVRRDSIGGQWQQGGFSDFIDGIAYMFSYASSVSKPCVINISWGSQSGPHDGSSLFNQACDALTGPGKILVMSAGNDGRDRIHLGKTFSATDTALTTFLRFAPAHYQRTWIDAWGEAGKTWCVDATLYRNGTPASSTVSVCLDNNTHKHYLVGTNPADTCFLEFINDTATYNNRPRGIVSVFNKTTDTLRLRYRATSGTMHLWNEYYYYGYDYGFRSTFAKLGRPDATEGDTMMTVSDMGAGQSVLLVGAYVSKTSWRPLGSSITVGYSSETRNAMASFSSIGPYADGRVKPDIAAPGLTIATGVSSYDPDYAPSGASKDLLRSSFTNPSTGRTYYYGEFTGTSAAAPAASGIVALLLQAKPDLKPADVKALLFQTAIQDVYTGVVPAAGLPTWGHGKINAYGALKLLAQQMGVVQTSGNRPPDCTLFPNPATGLWTLHRTGAGAETLYVNVYTSTGALVRSRVWTAAGGTSQLALDAAGLPAGVYLVHVQGAAGATTIRAVLR